MVVSQVNAYMGNARLYRFKEHQIAFFEGIAIEQLPYGTKLLNSGAHKVGTKNMGVYLLYESRTIDTVFAGATKAVRGTKPGINKAVEGSVDDEPGSYLQHSGELLLQRVGKGRTNFFCLESRQGCIICYF